MRCSQRWCGFALAAARILLAPEPVAAQRVARALDVPYVAQSEALCGGAASAMVLRYWGARGVSAEEFVSAAEPPGATASRPACWLTRWSSGAGVRSLSRARPRASPHHLSRQRPIIALIAIAPGRFHYVVLVEITDSLVVYHDPASRPFQAMSMADFERAWSASSRWSLLVMPGETAARHDTPLKRPHATSRGLPARLAAGRHRCRATPVRPRRTTDRRRARRVSLAARAAARAGRPALAAVADGRCRAAGARGRCARLFGPSRLEILGTAEFLQRNQAAALSAWNHAGEPVTDLVRVEGLARTRHRVVTDRIGLAPGRLLTSSDLERARRRLSELPAGGPSRVDVAPVGGGLVEVHAATLERPLMPTTPLALGTLGVRALATREATWQVASPTGSGERLDVTARWWESRPAVAVALSIPLQSRLISGVLRVEGSFARESFEPSSPGGKPAD